MEEVSRISKNTAVLVVAKVISSGLVFLLAILINRRLGPELAGIYTYAFVLYTIFQVIPDFGIGNISVRDVSRNLGRMHFYFSNIVSLRYLLSMGALALLMLTNVATWLLQRGDPLAGEKFWAVFALSFCLLLEQPLSNSLAENFIAMQRLEVIAMVYLMMGAIRVAFSSWFILRGTGPTLVLLMLVYIASVLYTIAHFYWLYQRWRRREAARLAGEEGEEVVAPATGDQAVSPALEAAEVALMETPDDMGVAALSKLEEPEGSPERPEDISDGRDLQRYLMRSAWPLALAAVGITVYAGLDVPLLSWIKGDWDVGMYSSAAMYAKAFIFLTLAVNMALLPALSKLGSEHRERLGEVWERLIRYTLVLVLPMTVLVPILARPMLILQQHDFLAAWPAVWLSMAAMVFTFMGAVSFPFFVVIDRQKAISRIIFIGLLLRIVINLVLISLWGYMGAAIGVVLSESVVFAMFYWSLRRELGHSIRLVRFFALPLLSLGALYAVALGLEKVLVSGKVFTHQFLSSLEYAAIIALAVVVLYAALVWLTRTIDRAGLQQLNSLLQVETDDNE